MHGDPALSAIDSEILHGSRLAGATLTSQLHQGSRRNPKPPFRSTPRRAQPDFRSEPLLGTVTYTTTSKVFSTTWPKTPAENMLIAWNKVGFSVEDPTAAEIADYQATHSKLPPEKLTDEAVSQQLMIMEMEVATGTYRDESVAAYKEMYSHLGKDLAVPVGSLATS